jgi:hypothetical protein
MENEEDQQFQQHDLTGLLQLAEFKNRSLPSYKENEEDQQVQQQDLPTLLQESEFRN